MNDGQTRCNHGYVITRTVEKNGWFTVYADNCPLCDGKPAKLEWK